MATLKAIICSILILWIYTYGLWSIRFTMDGIRWDYTHDTGKRHVVHEWQLRMKSYKVQCVFFWMVPLEVSIDISGEPKKSRSKTFGPIYGESCRFIGLFSPFGGKIHGTMFTYGTICMMKRNHHVFLLVDFRLMSSQQTEKMEQGLKFATANIEKHWGMRQVRNHISRKNIRYVTLSSSKNEKISI